MNIPLLQSKQWQKLQDDLGEKSHMKEEKDFSYLAIEKSTPFGKYLYVPYGPCYDTEKGLKNAIKSLQELAKTVNAFFIRIEPRDPKNAKFLTTSTKINGLSVKKSKDINPKNSWALDITAEKEDIIKNFSQGTRTRYNQFAKKGLTVEISQDINDIKYLTYLQQKLAKEKNISAFSGDYLKTELKQPFATLYLVKYEQKVIVASLFFDYKDTRFYMQSAADSEYKKLPGTVALLTTAIFDAKEKGLKTFDFWGIAPDGAPKTHPWAGFTEFKKSFGGFPIDYCGTYDLILKSQKYSLYKLFRNFNRRIRKIKH